jgi:hypothetical protein
MIYYIVKEIDGVHKIKAKTDSPYAPRGCFAIPSSKEIEFPIVVKNGFRLEIQNDESKTCTPPLDIKQILLDQVQSATKVSDLKKILKLIIENF